MVVVPERAAALVSRVEVLERTLYAVAAACRHRVGRGTPRVRRRLGTKCRVAVCLAGFRVSGFSLQT